ncbi:hypothetical protein OESDEN_20872 [Oesophagostomum dentatum]|uniref:Uncharacterized protein n=1 Tax=Oesophagostomum dentatum TaxID=61180 RepID=A0A0B1S8B5_OESDE|nr:hypothetical protein OESDEN_20872 [Oesophagostomum dentatum]
MPAFTCLLIYTTIHLSMVVERAIALKNLSTYESSSALTGLFFACGLSTYCLKEYNLAGKMIYCAATTSNTLREISLVGYSSVVLEAFTIIFFCHVYRMSLKKRSSLSTLFVRLCCSGGFLTAIVDYGIRICPECC